MKAIRLWVALLAVQASVWAQGFTITTPCPAPQGTVGVYYELQLESANGKAPVRYSYMDGLLPPGLTFTQGGSLYGTPVAQGTLNFTIRATDDNNTTVTKNCSIAMQPSAANPLQILTACPIQAPSNQSYSTTLTAGGGLPPYVWTLALGSLPQGFFLGASNGTISGTTSQNGTFRFVLNVNDNSSQRAVKECTMATAPAGGNQFLLSSIDPSQAPAGSAGLTMTLAGSGFNTSTSAVWNYGSANQTTLTTEFVDTRTLRAAVPAALLAAGGQFPVTVRRGVLTAYEYANVLPFSVSGGLTIKTACPLPSAGINSPYSQQLSAEGGVQPYTWSLANGALPQGLGLTANGAVTGTPLNSGLSNFTLRVADSQGRMAEAACSLRVVGQFEVKPALLTFVTTQGHSPAAQELSVTAGSAGVPLTVQAPAANWLRTTLSGATAPSRLRVEVDSALLPQGSYTASLTVIGGAGAAGPVTVPVVLQVNAAAPAAVQVRPRGLAFRAPRDWGLPLYRHLVVANPGPGTYNYQISVAPVTGGNWLFAVDSTGTVTPGQPAYALLKADTAGLAPGSYLARVTVGAGAVLPPKTLLASLHIGSGGEQLGASTSALSFRAVMGGGPPPGEDLDVLSQGASPLFWQSVGSGAAGVGNFLRADPASDSAVPTRPSRVKVLADTTGLQPGLYSGVLRVQSGADNSPRLVTAHLRLLAAGQQPGLHVGGGGMLFTSRQGEADPPAQTVTLTNPGASQASLDLALSGDTRAFRLASDLPGTLGPGESRTIPITVSAQGLAAGVYEAGLVAALGGDAQVKIIPLRLVIAPPRACARAFLTVAPVQPVQGFVATAGSGVPVRVKVVDNCAEPLTFGAVTARLSAGDGLQGTLTHLGGGIWSGDVAVPGTASSTQLRLEIQAESDVQYRGQAAVYGAADDTVSIPELVDDGVLSLSTYLEGQPLAPGGLVAAFGTNLSDRTASTFPPAASLGGAVAFLSNPAAGLGTAPLFFASPGQINGELPRDVLGGVVRQMVVQRGGQISRPVEVALAAVQPGIFTVNQQGTGQGAIQDASTTAELGVGVLAAPGTAVGRGRVIAIYCEGLGRTSPEVENGTPAPSAEPLARTVNPVTVTVGGRPAEVLYAGLAPGFVGLYQVNAVVPGDAPSGDAVPVIVSARGVSSNAATIAVK